MTMPRFHINVHNYTGSICDDEGAELTDLAAAARRATMGVRSILAEELLGGALDLRGRVEITDEKGAILQVIRFTDLVEVIRDAGE